MHVCRSWCFQPTDHFYTKALPGIAKAEKDLKEAVKSILSRVSQVEDCFRELRDSSRATLPLVPADGDFDDVLRDYFEVALTQPGTPLPDDTRRALGQLSYKDLLIVLFIHVSAWKHFPLFL